MSDPQPQSISYAERAAFYDIDYDDTSDHEFLASLITSEVRSVLEVPCGVGKITLVLAREGLRYVAVDLESQMIARLRQRVADSVAYKDLSMMVGDLRDLQLNECFDLILLQRESFQLAVAKEDALGSLISLRRHLNPQGVLVIDLAAFQKGDPPDPEMQPKYYNPDLADGERVVEWEKRLQDGRRIIRSREQHHPTDQQVVIRFYYDVCDESGNQTAWTTDLSLVTYTHGQFLNLVNQAKLSVDQVYRNYRREPFQSGAVRMIFLLRNKSE